MTDDEKLIELICKGNKEAEIFLDAYRTLAHQIDDVVDIKEITTEFVLRTFMSSVTLFGLNKFFCEHREFLYPLIIVSLNCYATSVPWEGSKLVHHQRMADILRSGANTVLMFVALFCGGIKHMRECTPVILELSWRLHHDKDNNPI